MFQRTEIVRKLFYANLAVFIMTSVAALSSFPLINILALWPGDNFSIFGLFTHMFTHANLLHFAMNMLALLSVGPGVEMYMNKNRFLIYFLLMGLGAAGLQLLFTTTMAPMVGASGAIGGLIAYFCLSNPDVKFAFPPVKAKWLLKGFIGISILAIIMGWGGNIAHYAHLGGFFTGIGLFYFDKYRR